MVMLMGNDESAVKKIAEAEAYLEKRMAELGKVAEIKAYTEKRIAELSEEVSRLRSLLEVVNSLLVERSFERAAEAESLKPTTPISQSTVLKEVAVDTLSIREILEQIEAKPKQPKYATVIPPPTSPKEVAVAPQPTVPEAASEQVVPIKTVDGVHLADLQISSIELKVVPASNLKFNINSSPLKVFLLSKVLEPMQAKDMEGVKAGSTPPDKVLSYKLEQEADLLKAIVIKNYGDEERLTYLKNAVRWTLRRMYEKLNSQPVKSYTLVASSLR